MFDHFIIKKKESILVVCILIILTLGIYWPVQHYDFINYDDQDYVSSNYRIQSAINLNSILSTFHDFHSGLWHPVTYISHMIDWQLFGFRAGGHHWTNVILHIFNTVLLFSLFSNLTGAVWRSAFVAALFAVHPMNVESVAWVAERKNVLSTFFWLLTMLFYVRYVKQPGWKRYLPVFISFTLGLMSKPMLVTLPFVLLLMDYWPLNRLQINLSSEDQSKATTVFFVKDSKIYWLILEKVPLFILSVICIYFTIYASQFVNDITSFSDLPLVKRIANINVSYIMYIKKLFWPANLTIFYPYIHVQTRTVLISAFLLISMTAIFCKHYKKYPYLIVGWFWYLGTLVPVIGLIQVGRQSMADHYAYVPFIGLFVMIVWGVEQILSKKISVLKLLIIIFVFIIAVFTVLTHNQIRLWTNTVTLFDDALKKNSDNFLAYYALGLDAMEKSKNEQALYYYDKAIRANPQFWPAYNNKGLILKTLGQREEALQNFQKAIQANKFSVEAYHNIGAYYYENKKFDEAVKFFLKAIEIDPLYIESYNYLGVALVEKGKMQEGIKYFEKALHIDPNNGNAQKNLKIAREMILKK